MAAETPREALAEALRDADHLGVGPDDDWYADTILAALPAGWSLVRTPSELPDAPSLGDGEDGRELRLLREALPEGWTVDYQSSPSGLPSEHSVWVGGMDGQFRAKSYGETIASAARLCRERLGAGR